MLEKKGINSDAILKKTMNGSERELRTTKKEVQMMTEELFNNYTHEELKNFPRPFIDQFVNDRLTFTQNELIQHNEKADKKKNMIDNDGLNTNLSVPCEAKNNDWKKEIKERVRESIISN